MIALGLAIFFMTYHGINSKIKNEYFTNFKRSIDYYSFKFLRRFAYSTNKYLFNSYYKKSIKIFRVVFIACIAWSLIGANPTYFGFLLLSSVLLMITFTSPKQLKKDFFSGVKFWSTKILFASLGLGIIWLMDLSEETDHFDKLTTMFIHNIVLSQQMSGLSPEVFWTIFVLLIISLFFFFYAFWAIMRCSAWISIYALKAYAKLSFWLNKKQPLAPIHLTGQILVVIITYFIEK